MAAPTFDSGPLADVNWYEDGFRAALVFVRQLRHPPGEFWPMLIEPELLEKWAPFRPDRRLDSVGAASFTMVDGSGETLEAVVEQVIEDSVLEFTWAKDIIRWDLTATETGTLLTLHHKVEAPDDIPGAAAGWHLCLYNAEAILDGEDARDMVGENAMAFGWQDLHDAYEKRLHAQGKGWPTDEIMKS